MKTFKFKNCERIDLTQIKIECENIDLVSISLKYAESIYEEFTEEITRYMIPSPPKSVDESRAFISSSMEGMKDEHDLVVAIISKSGEFLGCAGFHGRGKCNTPEFGVWLKKSAHGNGYGKTAIHALWGWALKNIEFDYAIYPVDVANERSRRIPESLGGVVFKELKVPCASGGYLDEIVYRVSA
ncbi:GNAT family N-acetyltransferase [Vibrio porteresiae]|uniref:GNAT family N-acetyltransferase n=1 Tax=Vibrio porteresiae DSM 19223 TaxID=1123496 RepID=A0ABZ0QJE8_9VIBR|nr:GNAT family N-acetyltransferase [Vibrio porteresiae]WPC75930.1 GNAT family N-acetyltransferase [Vibrio porteresiae DSM 19223]